MREDVAARAFLASVVLSGLAVLAGCNILVPVAYVLEGPGQIEAEYELRDVATVVFVDDQKSTFPRMALRAIVAETIAEQLVTTGTLPAAKMISARDTLALARQLESASNRVSIARIGREAGAEQIIYVTLEGFALTLDGHTPRPTSICRVKVIDLAVGRRVYPGAALPSGRAVQTQLREVDPDNFKTFARRRKVEDELAFETGVDVANLFHKHERVNLGEHLGYR
jgi:hypothetical protein